jgi:hypothetical protein
LRKWGVRVAGDGSPAKWSATAAGWWRRWGRTVAIFVVIRTIRVIVVVRRFWSVRVAWGWWTWWATGVAAESGEEFGEADGVAGVLVEACEDGGGAGGVHVRRGGEFGSGEVAAVVLVEFLEALGAFFDDFGAEGFLGGGSFGVAEFAITVGVERIGWLWAIGAGVLHGLDEGLTFFDGEFAVFVEIVGFEDFREFAGAEGVAFWWGGCLSEGRGDGAREDCGEQRWFEQFHDRGAGVVVWDRMGREAGPWKLIRSRFETGGERGGYKARNFSGGEVSGNGNPVREQR